MNEEKSSSGAIIGIIIIIIILIIGALYLWGGKLNKNQSANTTAAEILNQKDVATDNLKNVGTSDELTAIAADATATNLDNLSNETKNINLELTQ